MIKYDEFINVTENLVGNKFGDILDLSDVNKLNKGAIGQRIEVDIFNKTLDSKKEADLEIDISEVDNDKLVFNDTKRSTEDKNTMKVELKVTPIKRNKNGSLSAKERLVLSTINFLNEYKYTYKTSPSIEKNKNILIIFYEYLPNVSIKNLKIVHYLFYNFGEGDEETFISDYDLLNEYIKQGKAEDLGENKFKYLSPCVKGASSKTVRKQPFSDIPAKQRAFSLKTGYMTYLFRKSFNPDEFEEFNIKVDIIEYLNQKFEPYFGRSQLDILKEFGYEKVSKNANNIIMRNVLGYKGKTLNSIEEFAKEDIRLRTYTLENSKLKEEIKICNVDFKNIEFTDWEDSELFEIIQSPFVFALSNQNEGEDRKLIKFFKHNFTDEEIEQFRLLYEDTKAKVIEGIIIDEVKHGSKFKYVNNLMRKSDNKYVHIRPGAYTRMDKVTTSRGQEITKQAYWFNREGISKYLEE